MRRHKHNAHRKCREKTEQKYAQQSGEAAVSEKSLEGKYTTVWSGSEGDAKQIHGCVQVDMK